MRGRILVTGGGGFVGAHLIRALSRRDSAAAGMLLGESAPSEPPPPNWTSVIANIVDGDKLDAAVASFRPDTVIHLAAQSSASRSLGAAASTWSVNLTGSLHLALAVARHAPDSVFLFASSADVYGSSFLSSPVSEDSTINPLNPYARSKAAAERVLADVLPETCRLVVARPFNHTGPGQSEDFVMPSFAAQIARIERGLQPPRIETGNLAVRRDLLDVRDVVDAYIALLDAAPDLPPRTLFNIASGAPHLLSDLLEQMRTLARHDFDIVAVPERMRPNDLPLAYAKPERLRKATHWEPRIAMADTLAALLDYWRAKIGAGKV
jgi:GDP-4-dehydro-6-deoxy-D-mannose reductase